MVFKTTSPLANYPGQWPYSEGVTIDKGVDRARRDAANFANQYSASFQLLEASTEQFSICWVSALQQIRDEETRSLNSRNKSKLSLWFRSPSSDSKYTFET